MMRFKPLRLAVCVLLPGIVLPTGARAQANTSDPAWTRAHHLSRGINASVWFAQSRDYSVERLRSFTTEDDIALIEKLGFDHVRLSVDAAPLQGGGGPPGRPSPFLGELDRVVDAMLAHHLTVILDVHPESS